MNMTPSNQCLQLKLQESCPLFSNYSAPNMSLSYISFGQDSATSNYASNREISEAFYNGEDDELISEIDMDEETDSISNDSFEHLFDSEDEGENENEDNIFMDDELLSNIDIRRIHDYLAEFDVNNYGECNTFMESCNSFSIVSNEV